MSDLIEQTIQAAKTAGQQTLKTETTVQIQMDKAVEAAIGAWGAQIGTSRGAPHWAKVEPFIANLNKERAKLVFATDENGNGAFVFDLAESQTSHFTELKVMLTEIATEVKVPQEAIERAGLAFDRLVSGLRIEEAYDSEMASVAIGAFLEKTAELNPIVFHERFGELGAKSLISLAKLKAVPAIDGGEPNGDDAIAAQMPREMLASDSQRYLSMGQMVKAKDHVALAAYIQKVKDEEKWDEDRIEACNKLMPMAAVQGFIDVVRVLLEKGGANPDVGDGQGYTALAFACANNFPELIDVMIQGGANKNVTPFDGRSLLMIAASHDAVDAIRKLNELGFDLEERSLEGRTALHHAALGDEDSSAVAAVKLLLELGADPRVVDDIGQEGGLRPEEYIDEKHDELYALLCEARKEWEAGRTGPQSKKSVAISKVRAQLGF